MEVVNLCLKYQNIFVFNLCLNYENIFLERYSKNIYPNHRSNNTAPYISTEEESLSVITDNETKLMIQNDTFTNHTTPYDVPVEIVVVLSMFYGIISMVAVLGNYLILHCPFLLRFRMYTQKISVMSLFRKWHGYLNRIDKQTNADSNQLFHCELGVSRCSNWSFLNTIPVSGTKKLNEMEKI